MAVPVLHVVDTLGFGGAERFLVGLVRHLDPKRFRPIVAWWSAPGPFAEDLTKAGIHVVGIGARGHRDLRALKRLVALMREEHVRIVHTHLFVDSFYGRVAALLAGVPVRVVTQQNAYDDPALRLPAWQIWANRAFVPVTQQFVAVSRAAGDYLHNVEWVPRRKIRVIPNAIEPPGVVSETEGRALRTQWAADGGEGPLIGTVARLEPQKGLDTLIDAVALMRERLPDLRCVLVGTGALEHTLRDHARARGVADHVIFAGTRKDIPAVLSALDVFVLPSRFEGLSLALLEAMAAGTPVVATPVSGTVEVVKEGETGLLAPVGDAVVLAERIEALLEQPGLARRLSEQARELVLRRYTIQAVAQAYMSIYEDLLGFR